MPTRLVFLLLLAILLAGCRTPGKPAAEEVVAPVEIVLPPTTTRGEFTIEADKLDTWNAVGQIAVRTLGVEYEGRAQMMDLYVLRYRGVDLLVLTKAVPTSETIKRLTTKVTATTPAGKPIDNDAVAELLALFQRELPAEIESVRAKQAAEKKAKAKAKAKNSKKKKKSSGAKVHSDPCFRSVFSNPCFRVTSRSNRAAFPHDQASVGNGQIRHGSGLGIGLEDSHEPSLWVKECRFGPLRYSTRFVQLGRTPEVRQTFELQCTCYLAVSDQMPSIIIGDAAIAIGEDAWGRQSP